MAVLWTTEGKNEEVKRKDNNFLKALTKSPFISQVYNLPLTKAAYKRHEMREVKFNSNFMIIFHRRCIRPRVIIIPKCVPRRFL